VGFDLTRKLDYSDYAAIPDDGKRHEIVDGEHFVTPSPTPVHQRVSRRLAGQLDDYFHGRSIGELFYAPIDVIFTNHDILVPDLIVVADPDLISKRGIEGPPLLVVEILSPSTRRRDEGLKARRYAELGVEHYWIVDPERKRLECHRREGSAFHRVVQAEGDTVLTHTDWDGLAIDLAALWL